EVLNCEDMITAAENKDGFELVVQRLAGDKEDANMLSNIYEEINQIVQESEEEEAEEVTNLDYNVVEHILSSNRVEDIDTEMLKNTLQTVFNDEQHDFIVDTLLQKNVEI